MFFRRRSNHGIVAATAERMAAENARESHPSATQSPIPFYSLHRILRTGRHKAAGRRQQRRNRPFISKQNSQRDEFGASVQHQFLKSVFGFPPILSAAASEAVFSARGLTFCSITLIARLTSF